MTILHVCRIVLLSSVSRSRPRCPNSTSANEASKPSLQSCMEALVSPPECDGHCGALIHSFTARDQHLACSDDEVTTIAFIARLSVKLTHDLRSGPATLYRTAHGTRTPAITSATSLTMVVVLLLMLCDADLVSGRAKPGPGPDENLIITEENLMVLIPTLVTRLRNGSQENPDDQRSVVPFLARGDHLCHPPTQE